MKKVFGFLFAIAFVFTLNHNEAKAAPAPPLTDLQIIGVTSDGANYKWEYISFDQTSASYPMSGETGYIAVYVEGTELYGWFRIYNKGQDITSIAKEIIDMREPVTDSSGMVIGWIKYYEIPLDKVESGQFTVSARDYYPPNNTFYDNLYINVE
ncbi:MULTISPECIES: DUF4879 domain-containing protein [Geobacillus]|jgi:hypothetical protein|uniref:YolA n=3 Tax=Anoxybacillaceae TaxID=3120669 RepID=A4IS43_GEOTN|nr:MULTISPECIES: DUF4879 domain-containing protein [Geobacillus]ABO68147.1 YolA [Geobacillus thermodenitrificans NG80-2]